MDQLAEFFEDEILKEQTYYHGTTDLFKISEIKPPVESKIIREDSRIDNRNVVYVTSSIGSAKSYAEKAAKKFGGQPIVYRVEPDWDSLIHRMDYEYTTDFAKILDPID